MTDNLRIWNALSKTDPKHTKQFSRAGGFKGTATKPIWLTMRLTEHFGPAGSGWGMGEPSFQVVPAGDEILVFCTVSLWYQEGSGPATVYGVGGDKVLAKRQSGSFANDEAFKASYTDALSNAMKQIGVAADIHMGLFDDQKYVREVAQEFASAADADIERLAPKDTPRNPETGELLSNYKINAAKAAKTWADTAIDTLDMALSPEHVDQWREDNARALERLEKNHIEQFKRVDKKAEEVRDNRKAQAA